MLPIHDGKAYRIAADCGMGFDGDSPGTWDWQLAPARTSLTFPPVTTLDCAPAPSASEPLVRPGWAGFAPWLFFAALWLVLCRHLSSEWSINEQYNYGWFVPFFAAYLFWLRWEDRPAKAESEKRNGGIFAGGLAVLALWLLLPIRLFEIGNPDWRPLGWIHGFLVVGLTSYWLWLTGGARWLRHFLFPVAFFLVAVPWISAIEMPVVQGLMRIIAAAAAETLTLCGVPAQLEGNLIRVSSGLVGVNEACSGVRSLQTSLMIGLLFGELKRLSTGRRVALLGGAVTTALLANFVRAFWLVWVAATENVAAVSRWHDFAGYVIVGAVFAVSMGLASLLGKGHDESTKHAAGGGGAERETIDRRSAFPLSTSAFLFGLSWLLAVEVGSEFWYRAHERDLIPQTPWRMNWPEKATGFRELKIDEGVARTLRFDSGREAAWSLPGGPGLRLGESAPTCLAYFFRWGAGGSSVVRARAHRPDICLPSAGWDQLADRGVAEYEIGGRNAVAFRHVSFRRRGATTIAHTFFCLEEDQRRPSEARPDLELAAGLQPDWSLPGRWRVVRNGVRNLGQQVLEVVLVTPGSTDEASAERMFAAMLPGLITTGAR